MHLSPNPPILSDFRVGHYSWSADFWPVFTEGLTNTQPIVTISRKIHKNVTLW